MDRYARLLKQKDKALGIFQKIQHQLVGVIDEVTAEVGLVERRIEDALSRVEEETRAKEFLARTKKEVEDKLEKITAFFN